MAFPHDYTLLNAEGYKIPPPHARLKWYKKHVSSLNYKSAKREALTRLAQLPSSFYYHSLSHTRDDVLCAAETFAAAEGASNDDLMLVRTAALYHDIGFTATYEEHEQAGVTIAERVLPKYGYSPEQIILVCDMIMATKLPQKPRTLLEEIVADADLDILGRSDFIVRNQDLRRELAERKKPMSDREWYTQQIKFLEGHKYFTQAAIRLRTAQKARNLEKLVGKFELASVVS